MRKYILVLATLFVVVSCKNAKKETSKTNEAKYVLANAVNSINFTAFKTTQRIGVKGQFTEVEITNNQQGNTVKEAINGAEFKVPVSSIETNDSSRNAKLVMFFFGTMANTEYLSGKINLTDEVNGFVDFKMNDITEKLPFTYTIEGNVFSMKALMNVDNWKGQEAIAKLNSACEELHMGEDGITKTWSEVEIEITTTF